MNAPRTAGPVLAIRGLTFALPSLADRPHAVEALDLSIAPGETLCVVGESGSGKSMAAVRLVQGQVGRLEADHPTHADRGAGGRR